MDVLKGAPDGIDSAAAALNKISNDVLSEMCGNVLNFLQYKVGKLDVNVIHQRVAQSGCDCDKDDIQCAVNGLTYIFRSASKQKLTSEDLSKQLSSSFMWSSSTIDTIQKEWQRQGNALTSSQTLNESLNVGKLLDLKWKLGMATSPSLCKNLNSPFVSVTLTVAQPDGKINTKSIEMTIPEFQNFSRQMKEMATILETV